jgi:1,2-diacylglycerol 3-beta-glucosyltransferase
VQIVTVIAVAITIYVYVLAFLSSRVKVADDSGAEDLFFVLLVPALNEEQVIGRTLASLLTLRGNFLVLVIDDASDDGTVAAITPHLSDPRVHLMAQPPDQARRGKGHVLNTGYAAMRDLGLFERYGRENVVMVVFDSDARVEPDFLEAVAPYFSDPTIAGVQSAVRMYNADQNLLTLWQHLEFAVWGTLFCRAKNHLGSATLGGNGQCVRYSALESLGKEPWQPTSLTEDLDLSLRLLMQGWQLRFSPSAAVWQEAVPKLRALVRQRSRWLQGHLVCWQYLPALLRSRRPIYTRLDLLMFLLLPLAFLPIGVGSLVSWAGFLLLRHWDVSGLLAWYVLGFGMVPLVMIAWRKADHPSLRRLLLHSHLFVFYSIVWFIATWVVYWQVLLGRRAWAKTSRVGTGSGVGLPSPSTPPLVAQTTPALADVQLPPQTVQVLLEDKISDQDAALRDMMEEISTLGAALDRTQSRLDDAGARLEDFGRHIRQWKRQIAEQDVAFPARRKPGTGHRLKQPTRVEAVRQVKELRIRGARAIPPMAPSESPRPTTLLMAPEHASLLISERVVDVR